MKTKLPDPNRCYQRSPIYKFKHVLRFVRGLRSPAFSHARCHCVSPDSLTLYMRDKASPTGVFAGASIEREYGEIVMARLGCASFQLSPTEGQFSSHR